MVWLQRIAHRLRRPFRPPIRHGHEYVDNITGERIEVTSVGRNVALERCDAKYRIDATTRKSMFRLALSLGIVEHSDRCSACNPQ